jgi:hypothetical protein
LIIVTALSRSAATFLTSPMFSASAASVAPLVFGSFYNIEFTYAQAAERTGLTTDHIARLARSGQLVRVDGGAARILGRDVARFMAGRPRLATRSEDAYDPRADARTLARRRRSSANGDFDFASQ